MGVSWRFESAHFTILNFELLWAAVVMTLGTAVHAHIVSRF